jgi:hypothetical protein
VALASKSYSSIVAGAVKAIAGRWDCRARIPRTYKNHSLDIQEWHGIVSSGPPGFLGKALMAGYI